MVSAKAFGRKIDFVRNCITESTTFFSSLSSFFIFTPIIGPMINGFKEKIIFIWKY